MTPPYIIVPGVFSPALCHKLIDLHGTTNRESGFMWPQEDGKYAERIEPSLKSRTDHYVTDPVTTYDLVNALTNRLIRPNLPREFWHIERHLVARYDAPGGRFAPHTDNLFPGTRHRQWAVSVALNHDFDGGFLCLHDGPGRGIGPRAEAGDAVVFPCSREHSVAPVTRGSRYAYLTFLFDDAHEAIRQRELAELAIPGA
ncbi:2OG-Fe(II) oxygenase [Roseomonas sp. WA12]